MDEGDPEGWSFVPAGADLESQLTADRGAGEGEEGEGGHRGGDAGLGSDHVEPGGDGGGEVVERKLGIGFEAGIVVGGVAVDVAGDVAALVRCDRGGGHGGGVRSGGAGSRGAARCWVQNSTYVRIWQVGDVELEKVSGACVTSALIWMHATYEAALANPIAWP